MWGDKDGVTRWLRDYENRRLNPDGIRSGTGSGSRLNWHSKYDLENMSWQEVQDKEYSKHGITTKANARLHA